MRLKGPEGTSTFQTPKGRKAVFLATGTGIASVKSIVSTLVENNDLEGRELFIYWGVRTSQELVVGEIFEEWAAAHPQIHYTGVVSREDTWPGAKGHVQTFAAADNGDMTDMDAYLCGSNSMIKAAVNYLTARCGLREGSHLHGQLRFLIFPTAGPNPKACPDNNHRKRKPLASGKIQGL